MERPRSPASARWAISPESLVNYLALLGWGAVGGDARNSSRPKNWSANSSWSASAASAAVFDFDKLNWINRHYLKLADPARVTDLSWPYFVAAGLLEPEQAPEVAAWFTKLLALFIPAVDRVDQLPGKTHFVFKLDPAAAEAEPENAELLATENSRKVLAALAARLTDYDEPVTAEQFKIWMNEIKTETGVKGKELFHPVRIALTGSHSGPEFDKLIPLIEEGSTLALPEHIPSVRERVTNFLANPK
jgi:nondiscriminating glutamyl-tRNA synthetase